MRAVEKEYGGLRTVLVDALPRGAMPSAVVVLCHGFGANGDDLVPLAPAILEQSPRLAGRVRFAFPEAPLAPPEMAMFGGRAWWPLNVAALAEAIAAGEFRNLRKACPPELPSVRAQLIALVDQIRAECELPLDCVALGGFSQGAMATVDAALHLAGPPLALCVYSGTLLCEAEWTALAQRRPGLVVLQSHGRHDPILPFEGALWLRDMLLAAGASVEFLPFSGEHTIPAAVVDHTAVLLDRLVG